jgi:hypothetical protein
MVSGIVSSVAETVSMIALAAAGRGVRMNAASTVTKNDMP